MVYQKRKKREVKEFIIKRKKNKNRENNKNRKKRKKKKEEYESEKRERKRREDWRGKGRRVFCVRKVSLSNFRLNRGHVGGVAQW